MRQVLLKKSLVTIIALTAAALSVYAADKEDLSKKRQHISKHRELPMMMKLPKSGMKLPEGKKTKNWVFRTGDEKFEHDMSVFTTLLEKSKETLEMLKDPKKEVKGGDRDTFIKQVSNNIRQIEALKKQLKTFYGTNVRFAVEDKEDPTSGMLIKAILIRKDFKMENGIAQARKRRPPWRAHLNEFKPTTVTDKELPPLRGRSGIWKRHLLLMRTKARPLTPGGPGAERVYFDLTLLYRATVKTGSCYMVEIYCHWQEDGGKDETFAKRFYNMVNGLRF